MKEKEEYVKVMEERRKAKAEKGLGKKRSLDLYKKTGGSAL